MNDERYIKRDGNEIYVYEDMKAERYFQQIEGTPDLIDMSSGDIYELKMQYTQEQKRIMERKERQREFKTHNKRFYMFYAEAINRLVSAKLSDMELGCVWYLARKVGYYDTADTDGDFVPLIKSQKNKSAMSDQDIRKLLKLDGRGADSTWAKLKRKCVECGAWKVVDGYIYINRMFFFKGAIPKQLAKEVVVLKTLSGKTDLGLGKEQLKAIGTLLKLSRYVNPVNNSLVKNPSETDESKLEYIQNVTELCKVTGITRNAYKKLWSTKVNGKTLVGEWRNAYGTKIVINFDILYRGDYLSIQDNLTGNDVQLKTLFCK